MLVNQGRWAQESWDTGNPGIRKRVKELRAKGYQVITSAMGLQVTKLGTMKLTLIDIRPGVNADTLGIEDVSPNI